MRDIVPTVQLYGTTTARRRHHDERQKVRPAVQRRDLYRYRGGTGSCTAVPSFCTTRAYSLYGGAPQQHYGGAEPDSPATVAAARVSACPAPTISPSRHHRRRRRCHRRQRRQNRSGAGVGMGAEAAGRRPRRRLGTNNFRSLLPIDDFVKLPIGRGTHQIFFHLGGRRGVGPED